MSPHFLFSLKDFAIYTRFVAKILLGPSLEKFLAAPMDSCFTSVYQKEPPVPPSEAQVLIVEAASHENYIASLRRLIFNSNFLLLTLTYGRYLL